MRLFTRTDNPKADILNDMAAKSREIHDCVQKSDVNLGPDMELYLESPLHLLNPGIKYYLLNHSPRCIFWLEDFFAPPLYKGLQGIHRLLDIRFSMEAEYWTHCEMFPHNREVSPKVVEEEL